MEYKLLEIASDHIKLKHLSTFTKDGKESASGRIVEFSEPDRILDWLARPIEERFKEHIENVKHICERFTRDEL